MSLGFFQRSLIVLVSLIIILSLPLPVAANPSMKQLEQVQQELQREQSGIQQQRDRILRLEEGAENHLQGLQRNLKTTETQLLQTERKLQQITQTLKTSQRQLTTAQIAYGQQVAVTVARLRFLQRQLKRHGLAVLLDSENFSEFLNRRYQLKRLYQADRQALVKLKSQASQIQQQKQQIEVQKNQVALMRQELLIQKSDVSTQAQVQQELIERLKSDRTALEAAQIQLKEDSQGIAFLIRQRVTPGMPYLPNPGQMMLPNIGEISSAFGWRVHPILGDSRFHAGVDFAADYGSLIYAAHNGVVIFAGWYGGYGNSVVIDRGDGITTLYAHASELYVQEGQQVKTGQAIATVGSTGLSTGPHLHFEVRENGEPVDPMNYLA